MLAKRVEMDSLIYAIGLEMIQFNDVLSNIINHNFYNTLPNVIVICDPGVDDALMLLQILNTTLYRVTGVIPIEGNSSYKITLQNTLNICEYIEKYNTDIYPCSDYFDQKPLRINIAPVYGENALCGLTLPQAIKMKPQNINGVDFAYNELKNNKYFIISTGPLTELAKILVRIEQDKVTSLNNILAISIMGGVMNPLQEANWPVIGLRQSEANFSFDFPSTQLTLDICQRYHIPIILTPLDLSHSILACKSDLRFLNNTYNRPTQKLAKYLIENVPSHYKSRYGLGPNYEYRQPLHDVHASNCLINPHHYYGKWSNINISSAQTGLLTINTADNGNVFLLDMHYHNRQLFFNDLFKNYE